MVSERRQDRYGAEKKYADIFKPNYQGCIRFSEENVFKSKILEYFCNFRYMLPCIVKNFLFSNQPDALIIQIYSVIKLYVFRASSLPIIRNFLMYIRHWYVSRRFLMTASKQSQDGKAVPS
jgi:hypothetical protein